jgi:septum formation inhibitor MinC
LCELADGVAGNMDCFIFTSQGSHTLKYINDVTDHIEKRKGKVTPKLAYVALRGPGG